MDKLTSRNFILYFFLSSQAGKVSIRLEDIGDPDMVTIVGHKIGAPKVSSELISTAVNIICVRFIGRPSTNPPLAFLLPFAVVFRKISRESRLCTSDRIAWTKTAVGSNPTGKSATARC